MKKKIVGLLCILTSVILLVSCSSVSSNQEIVSDKIDVKEDTPLSSNIELESEIIDTDNWGVGDTVYFGKYEQDNDETNGPEDIAWIVLAKEGEKILIISEDALDGKKYDENIENITSWESCSLRKWLNEAFYQTAFTDEEKTRIQTTFVTADPNPDYDTPIEHDTQDNIFLLSVVEVNKYFATDTDRQCKLTQFAKTQGLDEGNHSFESDSCWWWLRTTGHRQDYAAFVDDEGEVDDRVKNFYSAVRPALWITR